MQINVHNTPETELLYGYDYRLCRLPVKGYFKMVVMVTIQKFPGHVHGLLIKMFQTDISSQSERSISHHWCLILN